MTWALDFEQAELEDLEQPDGASADDDGAGVSITAVRSLGGSASEFGPSAGPLPAGPFGDGGRLDVACHHVPSGLRADTECPAGILCLPKGYAQRRSAVCKTGQALRVRAARPGRGGQQDQRISWSNLPVLSFQSSASGRAALRLVMEGHFGQIGVDLGSCAADRRPRPPRARWR